MGKPANLSDYAELLSEQGKVYFTELTALIHEADPEVRATLFVHQPYFYAPRYETVKFHHRPSVMLTFFRDHVNIFALGNRKYEPQLSDYRFTEKHTMQIRYNQPLLHDLLVSLLKDSLHPEAA